MYVNKVKFYNMDYFKIEYLQTFVKENELSIKHIFLFLNRRYYGG